MNAARVQSRVQWSLADTLALLGAGRPEWSLTPDQRAAVGAPLEPGLILAGAGSGKTEVMAARVVHLVASRQVRPEEVLGLTFTTKATASLAARVRAGLERLRQLAASQSGAPLTLAELDGEPIVLTYNGYGARLLADHGLRIGVEPQARLAPEGLRWQLAMSVVRRWDGPLEVDLLPASVAERIRQLADEMSSHLTSAAEIRRATRQMQAMVAADPKAGAKAREALDKAEIRLQLLTLVEAFEKAKRDALLLDYGDQIALAAQLAAQPVVAAAERTAYRVVLLDEYQDTGVGQRILLQRLFGQGHPVTAVGDPAQSIYGFRGASVGNILRFPEHFRHASGEQAKVYPLLVNFRSGGAILEVANAVVAGLAAASGPQSLVEPPILVPRDGRETGGPESGEVRVRMLADAELEAQWVADAIAEAGAKRLVQHAAHCAQPDCEGWHEAAILCRRRSQFGLLRQALEIAGIPVEVVGLGGLLDAPEVADLVAVLRVLYDATANSDLVRLLTGPRWRVGLRDLDAMGRRASALVRGGPAGEAAPGAEAAAPLRIGSDEAEVGALCDVLEHLDDPDLTELAPLSPEADQRLRRLHDELASLRRRIDQPLPDLIADIERTTGLDIELEASPARLRRGRRANVLAFLDVAADFVGIDGQTDLGAFLASLDAAEKAEDGYDIGVPSAADAVKLMTVHAAKGLEWDVVAVPGLSKGVFPGARRTTPWPWRAEAVPGELRGDREDLPVWTDPSPAGCKRYLEAAKESEGYEERRLAYVAVTRAREVLLCSGFWWSSTAKKPLIPQSAFFAEIEAATAAGAGTVEEAAPEPEAADANPLLAQERHADVAWPPAPVVPDATRWAAAEVTRQIFGSSPDAPPNGAELNLRAVASAAEAERIAAWRRDADLLLRERAAAGGRRDVVMPQALSVSEVVEVARNPAGYAARLARPMPLAPAPAARRGTSFHAWVEQRSGGRRALLGPDDLPGASDESMAQPGDDLRALQDAFLSTSWAAREPIAVEVGFELVLAGVLIRGRIDAVYPTPEGRYDVIDYKTGARPTGPGAHEAAIQLACYRLAYAQIAGVAPEEVGAAFLYVREGERGLVRPELLSREELVEVLSDVPSADSRGVAGA